MIEERFVMKVECGYDESLVRDKQGDLMHIKDCCDMLNDFHNENQDLKHYHDEVLKCLHRTKKDYKEQVKKLQEENRQYQILTDELKRQNKKLKGRLNDLGVEYYE